jgi:type VI secretion system secreted protein Hcp
MAQTVHLRLRIDGNDVQGESSIQSLDREDTIECSSFRYGFKIDFDPATLRMSGARQHKAVIIQKKIDKTTPLLIKAFCRQELMDEANFMFFRPSPWGDGTEEMFYTVRLENGYVARVKQLSQDNIVGGEAAPPMMEEVTFAFRRITWTYEINGATCQDVASR